MNEMIRNDDNDNARVARHHHNRQDEWQRFEAMLLEMRPELVHGLERLLLNDPSFSSWSLQLDSSTVGDAGFCILFQEAIRRSNYFSHLTINEMILDGEEMQALARGISRSKLTFLAIHGSISLPLSPAQSAKDLWHLFYQGVQSCQTIQDLRFLHSRRKNDALIGLGNILPVMSSLQSLALNGLTLTEPVARALANGIGSSKQLTTLHMSGTMLCLMEIFTEPTPTDETWRAWHVLFDGITSCETIRELRFDIFPMEGFVSLALALPLMPSLRKLVLGFSVLTKPIALSLNFCFGMCRVESLTILNNMREKDKVISQPNWQILYQGLQSSTTMQELRLETVPEAGMCALAEVLLSVQTLRMATLYGLVFSVPEAHALAKGIRNSKLKALELSASSQLQQKDADEIFFRGIQSSVSIRSITTVEIPVLYMDAWTDLLLSLKTLKIVHFGHGRTAKTVEVVLFRSTSLTTLELAHGDLGVDGVTLLSRALAFRHYITSLTLMCCSGMDHRLGGGTHLFYSSILRYNRSLRQVSICACGMRVSSCWSAFGLRILPFKIYPCVPMRLELTEHGYSCNRHATILRSKSWILAVTTLVTTG
jgi:hypothetical protein